MVGDNCAGVLNITNIVRDMLRHRNYECAKYSAIREVSN